MRRFSFEVPSVPASVLRQNGSSHFSRSVFARRQEARREMEADWGLAIKAKRGELGIWDEPLFTGEVGIRFEVYWPPKRGGLDFDSLLPCFKRGIDQLEHQGIIADDRQINRASWSQEKDPEKRGFVRVTLEGE